MNAWLAIAITWATALIFYIWGRQVGWRQGTAATNDVVRAVEANHNRLMQLAAGATEHQSNYTMLSIKSMAEGERLILDAFGFAVAVLERQAELIDDGELAEESKALVADGRTLIARCNKALLPIEEQLTKISRTPRRPRRR